MTTSTATAIKFIDLERLWSKQYQEKEVTIVVNFQQTSEKRKKIVRKYRAKKSSKIITLFFDDNTQLEFDTSQLVPIEVYGEEAKTINDEIKNELIAKYNNLAKDLDTLIDLQEAYKSIVGLVNRDIDYYINRFTFDVDATRKQIEKLN